MTAGSRNIRIEQGSTLVVPMFLRSTVEVGTTPVRVGRAVPHVKNPGPSEVWFGADDTVTPLTGTLVPVGEVVEVSPAADVWLVSDVDEAVARVPMDLTGYAARMQIRPRVSSDTELLELTSEDGGIVIDGPSGQLTLFATDSQTSDLSFRTAVYDIEIVSPAPESYVTRVLQGKVTLSPEVTR